MPPLGRLVSDGEVQQQKRPTRKLREASKHQLCKPRAYPHIVTQHHYHDHAEDPVIEDAPCGPGKATPSSFPVKLHAILTQVENSGQSDVISWQPHGRCFLVHDTKAFKDLLPGYLKLSKIASFQRQLNLYGFQRLTTGSDKNGYYHELFLRGRPDLVKRMQRVKVKGTGVRAKANPTQEPNLYLFPTVYEEFPPVITPSSSEDALVTPLAIKKAEVKALRASLFCPLDHRDDPVMQIDCAGPTMQIDCAGPMIDDPMIDDDSSEDEDWVEPADPFTNISFDRLLDEMFLHDQNLEFGALLKLASL